MCGIAGLFDLTGLRPVDEARLGRMNAAMVHRGPDGDGLHTAPGIGLGHRRLAIIDLHTGHQPMADAQQQLQIVYNGEIYNYRALRRELEAKGHPFLTQSDTEAILQGYHAWGADVLTHLNGMFAIALWDTRAQSLLLARDRMGEKPLYYTVCEDGWVLFASEINAILAGLGAEPPIRPDAVADYFAYGYVPDPKTVFQGIHKLEPGYRLVLHRGMDPAQHQPEPYWRLSAAAGPALSAEDAEQELIERLTTAVRERMVADVPLGAFLSGGVDSSGIVALMAQNSATPVRTCAMGFPDPKYDETEYAQMVADRYATDHYREVVELEAVDLVERLALAYGEPFADPSALPTYRVSKLARSRVTVALSGDGGDEAFAGYRRYPFHMREEAVKARIPAALRRLIFGPAAWAYPRAAWAPRMFRAKATLEALSRDRASGYFRAITVLPDELRARLFSGDLHNSLAGYDPVSVIRDFAAQADSDNPLRVAQYVDMKTWLAGRMLVKVDRAAMANSLEVRPPLLDPSLVQWAIGLPDRLKVNGFEGKWILKRALEPLLPRELLYRTKQGFSMPLAGWLRGGLTPRIATLTATDSRLSTSGLFDMDFVRRLAADHSAGRADNSQVLWALIMFDAFLAKPWTSQADAMSRAA